MPYPDERTEAAIKRLRRMVGSLRVESPIEAKIYPALVLFWERQGCYVRAQYKLGHFRYDFAIFDPSGRLLALVECDGKAFHSSRRQRKRDRKKNQIARELGRPLFRFTGSQINEDAPGCVQSMGRWNGYWGGGL